MRELKFRAWDKSVEHLYEVQTLIDGGDAIGRYVLNGEMDYIHLCADEVIIEQYTGLKDKNGKEIYEGDIMRYDAIDYQVLWADYYAGFETKRLNSPWNNAGLTLHFLASVGRVIGNIHENQYLLDAANTINKEGKCES